VASAVEAPTAPFGKLICPVAKVMLPADRLIDPVPEMIMFPEVDVLPDVASITVAPIVSPLWTTKFEFAIVPYLPNSFNKVIYPI
jgi:hypothetical protein